MSEETYEITLTVNGEMLTKTVKVRQHLVDFLVFMFKGAWCNQHVVIFILLYNN